MLIKLDIEEDILRELYITERMSTTEIGTALRISRYRVTKQMDKHAIKRREPTGGARKKCDKPMRKTLEKLYIEEQKSTPEIGEILGTTRTSILNWLKEYGIKTRNVGWTPGRTSFIRGIPRKGTKYDEELKRKISKNRKGKGIPSVERRKLLSDMYRGKNNPMYGKRGNLAPSWKGGISFEPYCPKFNNELKETIRKKHNNICTMCGKPKQKRKLSVHHVDYNKSQGCHGFEWGLIPLHTKCHAKTNFNRWYWFALLRDYWIYEYEGFELFVVEQKKTSLKVGGIIKRSNHV